jgi:hypothetical protein
MEKRARCIRVEIRMDRDCGDKDRDQLSLVGRADDGR